METPPPQTSSLDKGPQEPKRATFAMEINVELDKRTGKTQVISTSTVTSDIIQRKGLKVYEDGRKSVYALPPCVGAAEEVSEMTPTDVEELLRQATDWRSDVQYHQPVYATLFSGTSRPSTPRISSKTTTPISVHSKRQPSLSHSQAESRLEVYQEFMESKDNTMRCDDMQRTYDESDSPYALLDTLIASSNSVTVPLQPKNRETRPLRATHRYEMDIITKSMNCDRLLDFISTSPTDRFAKSKTPNPVLSCPESAIEEIKEQMELDEIPTKNPQKNIDETLHHANDISNLASEDMSSPVQSLFKGKDISSLLVTHRYNQDLISPMEITDHCSQSKMLSPSFLTKSPSSIVRRHNDSPSTFSNQTVALVSVRASSDSMPTPTMPVYKNIEMSPPSPQGHGMGSHEINLDRNSPTYTESTDDSILEELLPGAVTMIFMGYENLDEDEEGCIQAKVVMIGGNNEEQDLNVEENLAMIYHPNGYTSKVYQPVVCVATVTDGSGYGKELPV